MSTPAVEKPPSRATNAIEWLVLWGITWFLDSLSVNAWLVPVVIVAGVVVLMWRNAAWPPKSWTVGQPKYVRPLVRTIGFIGAALLSLVIIQLGNNLPESENRSALNNTESSSSSPRVSEPETRSTPSERELGLPPNAAAQRGLPTEPRSDAPSSSEQAAPSVIPKPVLPEPSQQPRTSGRADAVRNSLNALNDLIEDGQKLRAVLVKQNGVFSSTLSTEIRRWEQRCLNVLRGIDLDAVVEFGDMPVGNDNMTPATLDVEVAFIIRKRNELIAGQQSPTRETVLRPGLPPMVWPAKMQDLFMRDFPTVSFVMPVRITKIAGKDYELQGQVYLDFDAGTRFIGFLIPPNVPTYEICVGISNSHEGLLKIFADTLKANNVQGLEAGNPGQPQRIPLESLKSSGRVVLYHEDHLSPRQIADLEDLYKDKQLSVLFRGPDYLAMQNATRPKHYDRLTP